MSAGYKLVQWNPQKRRYDLGIITAMIVYLALYFVFFSLINSATEETMLIRGFGTLAIIMLHFVLAIGPMARLNRNWLIFIYNRRHLGVMTFLVASTHGILSIFQYHGNGDVNPLRSVFTANPDYGSFYGFPFQTLGLAALIILGLMALTSHDFWNKTLGAKAWKRLHMMVYVAYILLFFHVLLGVGQQAEKPDFIVKAFSIGAVILAFLHLSVAVNRKRVANVVEEVEADAFVRVCPVEEIPEDRARIVRVGQTSIAVFKYDGKVAAVRNRCKHQGGPLGEGKIVDGCITCPWHGFQYLPENGQSPPPFDEKIQTYQTRIVDGMVEVDPTPRGEGEETPPTIISEAQ